MSDQEHEEQPKAEPQWERRDKFRINGEMQKVVKATIEATRAQVDLHRRKLEKLQYGS